MKKVLFAFIFSILGIGVGTIFSTSISNMVDKLASCILRNGQNIQKKVVITETKKETVKPIENPFKEEQKTEVKNPFEQPKAEIKNPFVEQAETSSTTPLSNPFEQPDVKAYLSEETEDDSVGTDSVSGEKVYEDDNGLYILDAETKEPIDIDEADVVFK